MTGVRTPLSLDQLGTGELLQIFLFLRQFCIIV